MMFENFFPLIGGKFKFKDSIRERYVNAADETESSLLASQKEEKYTEFKHSRSDTNDETKDEKTTYPPVGIDWPKEMKKVCTIPTYFVTLIGKKFSFVV